MFFLVFTGSNAGIKIIQVAILDFFSPHRGDICCTYYRQIWHTVPNFTLIGSYLGTQDWLQVDCPWLIEKSKWPPNSPDLNLLYITSMAPGWKSTTNSSQPYRTINELKVALQTM